MAAFPDYLPPNNIDIIYKLLIYFGIFYIISTAITAKLITKKRLKSIPSEKAESVTPKFQLKNDTDKIFYYSLEQKASEFSLNLIQNAKDEKKLSNSLYNELKKYYNSIHKTSSEKLKSIEEKSNKQNMEVIGDLDELQLQISELEDDDFLSDIEPDKTASTSISTDNAPTPTPPASSAPAPRPPASSAPAPRPPASSAPAPRPPASSAPAPKKRTTSGAPAPPPPKSFSQDIKPVFPATQQVKEDKNFAKSTSIAAIRMDMLRELARLKKLINEDEE